MVMSITNLQLSVSKPVNEHIYSVVSEVRFQRIDRLMLQRTVPYFTCITFFLLKTAVGNQCSSDEHLLPQSCTLLSATLITFVVQPNRRHDLKTSNQHFLDHGGATCMHGNKMQD
jgi:hypothetical protein